ncbi:uncharacterized protein K444DRAFT_542670 [Hyaloscypha bicolor E]|uniref:Uncharacterized protein n=1 Tax=Hyaloscypha bicolor E TaxID=1095630 RepID=A0A2J6SQL8_9HELO|nr:uncharacterized protein K444DRAFT_542670 [Hyaloscypha bicolor E]PMD52993.1 hypothetical protein K444DRAFT_542670 [Hyaloscypha bicolor E]
MTTYTIKVHNKSDASQHFLLFNEKPTSSNNISQLWTNVWVKSGVTDHPNGTATFKITSKFYGVCGTTDTAFASGVSVSTSDWADVNITTSSSNGTKLQMNVEDDGPVFDSSAVSTTSTTGSFAINTNSFDSTQHENVYCGLGRQSAHDSEDIIPVAVWTAKPSQDYEIAPVQKFFIATGTYSEGDVVNVADLGQTVVIDFTSTTYTNASTDFTTEYKYTSPKYS